MRMLMQKSGLVWEIDNVCLFLTYEVQSANSSPFISLCIVYSNIGHRAHKSSPCSAKTAPFVCTVLTDSILCPLTSSPQLLLSAQLCPLKYINWSVHSLSSENQLCFCFFWVCEIYNLWKKKIKKIYIRIVMHSADSPPRVRGCGRFPFPWTFSLHVIW